MSYQVLARKYRPQRFSEVIGQEHVTQTLRNAIRQGRIAHGYIFSGHRGIGKTTIARILAMALNCRATEGPNPEPCGVCESCTEIRAGNSVDVIEIDAATNRGIDEIRELREAARYRPARDRYKIYILDEAHQITDAAFNALLKTLEEPPSHIVFMMATTQPEDIPQTIRSRCQHFSFHAVKFDEIAGQLKDILDREGVQADEGAIAVVAEAGDGSMRDALSIMDQAIACCGTSLTADQVRGLVGAVSSETIERLIEAIQRNSSEEVLRLVDQLMTEGQSPAHFARQMVKFLRNAVVAKVAGADSQVLQISSDERARVNRVAVMFSEEDLTRFLQIVLRTYDEIGYKQEQRFHLELGLLKMVHAQRLLPLEELLSGASAGGLQAGSFAGASGGGRPAAAPSRPVAPASSPATAPSRPSPFQSDNARKTAETPKQTTPFGGTGPFDKGPRSLAVEAPKATLPGYGSAVAPAVSAARIETAVAVLDEPGEPSAAASESFPATVQDVSQVPTEPRADLRSAEMDVSAVRERILAALEAGGHSTLGFMLETGEWAIQGNELLIKAPHSATVLDLSLTVEARKIAQGAIQQAVGRPLKIKTVSGGTATANEHQPAPRSNGHIKGRVADDPMVKRMQEVFGAEIRTVIDHRK